MLKEYVNIQKRVLYEYMLNAQILIQEIFVHVVTAQVRWGLAKRCQTQ